MQSHTASPCQLPGACLQGGTELPVRSGSGPACVLLLPGLLICTGAGGLPGPAAAAGSGYCCPSAQTWRPPPRPHAKARPRAAEDSRGRQGSEEALGEADLEASEEGPRSPCLGPALPEGSVTEDLLGRRLGGCSRPRRGAVGLETTSACDLLSRGRGQI